MKQLNILIVEDEDDLFNSYQDAADDLETANLEINLTRCKKSDEALEELSKQEFHGAIVDLNLEGDTTPDQPSGVNVIAEIHKEYRIPIIVVSGNLGNLPDKYSQNTTEFLHIYDRSPDISNIEIFNKIIQIFDTGILNIIGGKGLIEEKLNKVFWEHLSKDIDEWYGKEEKTVEQSLLRYTTNHLSAYLEKSDDGSDSHYEEAEFYLKEPIKETISSGDILIDKKTNERYILLSPACDVEPRKGDGDKIFINAKSLVLAKVTDIAPDLLMKNGHIKSVGKDRVRSFIYSVVHGTILSCTFLPKYKEVEAGIVEFDNLITVPFHSYTDFYRVATVSVSFFKDIQSRFASYYARQGTPDLNKKRIVENYLAIHDCL
jgi:CheY-like chemotaxis protein